MEYLRYNLFEIINSNSKLLAVFKEYKQWHGTVLDNDIKIHKLFDSYERFVDSIEKIKTVDNISEKSFNKDLIELIKENLIELIKNNTENIPGNNRFNSIQYLINKNIYLFNKYCKAIDNKSKLNSLINNFINKFMSFHGPNDIEAFILCFKSLIDSNIDIEKIKKELYTKLDTKTKTDEDEDEYSSVFLSNIKKNNLLKDEEFKFFCYESEDDDCYNLIICPEKLPDILKKYPDILTNTTI